MNYKLLLILLPSLLLLAECDVKQRPEKTADKKLTKQAALGVSTKSTTKKPKQDPIKRQPKTKPATPSSQGQNVGSILSQVVQTGRFQPVGDTLTVKAGQNLDLRCKGTSVRWNYPHYLHEDDEGRLKIKHFGRYSQLILVNSSAADTGEFSCGGYQCSGHDCHDGEEKTGKTYVFVTDPQELFVPTEDYYVVVQLRTRQPALLPCQVTNPLAKVTLNREFPPEQIPVDGVKIAFDQKKGFVIYQPHPSLAGSLFCIAEHGNLRQMSTKYMLIYVHYPSAPPKPIIEASVKSVHAGENFVVTCTVLGELEISVEFTWEYPGQQIGRPPYVRENVSQTRRGGQLMQQSQSILYIDEARALDDGIYTCTAQNLQGSTSVTTRVTVLPPTSTTRVRNQG
ncbi:platelet-derived growth factor receptor-like protein [Bufo gargarizans]|uniref:platelet-derived growth factor receptor-like protein n=1 Tax=Bufo gargarizans TaxID=30331 RepID=UPI001CF418A9|nr:platelet-derived growth factor receptor-like protein [Bufo gargarizans]